ncbi:MAG: hypothetical protein ACI9L9_000322 [Marivirga sp.]|jgi:hypothetical protein
MKIFLNTIVFSAIKIWHAILAIGCTLVLCILFELIAAPIKTYHSWVGEELISAVSERTDSLARVLTYKQALLTASAEDSIYLVISLPDSSLLIYVKGVGIYSTKIIRQSKSTLLSLINSEVYKKQFASPLKANLLAATIEREPIKVKIAPKNAEEAAKMATIPDSVIFEPVFISYKTENGVLVNLSTEKEPWRSFKNYVADAGTTLRQLISAMLRLEIVAYEPEINLTVDNIELTSIYRALPLAPLILIQL